VALEGGGGKPVLTIRRDQINELARVPRDVFVDQMVVHLTRYFPERAQALGREGLRDQVRTGIERGASYGIVSERDLCDYLAVACALGPDFDRDPELPWAAEILNDETLPNPGDRMEEIYRCALEHCREEPS
jgi:hypothetical protein